MIEKYSERTKRMSDYFLENMPQQDFDGISFSIHDLLLL